MHRLYRVQCFRVEVLRVEGFLVRALGPYLASDRVTGSFQPPKRGLNKAQVVEKLAISRLLESLSYIIDNMRVSRCNWNKPPLADPGCNQNLVGVKKFTEIPLASLCRWASFCAAPATARIKKRCSTCLVWGCFPFGGLRKSAKTSSAKPLVIR